MARFVFKLEGVLRQRKTAEQQKQRDLAAIQSRMVVLEGELRAMDVSVKTATDDVRRNRLIGALDLSFLAAHRRYSFAMQRKAMELAGRMAVVQRDIDAARAGLIEAAKQRKVIEKLRERQMDLWREDRSKRESAQMEEIGLQMSYRHDVDDRGADHCGADLCGADGSEADDRGSEDRNAHDLHARDAAGGT